MDLRELFQAAYGNTSWGPDRQSPGMFPVGQGPAPQPDYSMNEPSMVSANPLERSRNELLDLLANAPGFQAPQAPIQPAFRTPDAIGLLLSGLLEGKRGIVDYSKTLLAGKQQKAAQETQNRDRQTEFQNQRTAQDYQNRVNVAKTKLGFTEEDTNRSYQEKARREASEGRLDLERLKGEMKIRGDAAKAASQERITKLKASFSKMTPQARAALAQSVGADPDVVEALTQLTAEEELKYSQSDLAKSRKETEDATRALKVQDIQSRINRRSQQNKQSTAQITKWQRDAETASGNLKQRKAEFEWRKKNPAGISYIDRQYDRLQRDRMDAQADLDALKGSMGVNGFFASPKELDAVKKLEQEIVSIDSQLKQMEGLGANASIERERQLARDAIKQRPDKENEIRQRFKVKTGADL